MGRLEHLKVGLAVHLIVLDGRLTKGLTRKELRAVFELAGELKGKNYLRYEFEKYLNDN